MKKQRACTCLKSLITILIILIKVGAFAQTNAHLPLKSYSFKMVGVTAKDSLNMPYIDVAQFNGVGEIYIYSDSITITWTNEWECGTYRLFVDTVTYNKYEEDGNVDWLSHYTVRSKGYHQVDGMLTLVEGSSIEDGLYTDVFFDTDIQPEGWARKRRIYLNIDKLR